MKKSARLDLPVLPQELDRWKAAAQLCGMPVEIWVRETVNVVLIPPAKEILREPGRRSGFGREHRRTRFAEQA